jgi:hypothetical protein
MQGMHAVCGICSTAHAWHVRCSCPGTARLLAHCLHVTVSHLLQRSQAVEFCECEALLPGLDHIPQMCAVRGDAGLVAFEMARHSQCSTNTEWRPTTKPDTAHNCSAASDTLAHSWLVRLACAVADFPTSHVELFDCSRVPYVTRAHGI